MIIFNRPETTELVFNAVKKYQPEVLYLFSDGPRASRPQDVGLSIRAKEVVEKVDWECVVHRNYLLDNIGCGYGPSSAITWALENEDRIIVLEDDCVPTQAFFIFCEELLERYLHDDRIAGISGNNPYEEFHFPYSYIFSNYGHSWGWATWKRAWKEFDIEWKDFMSFMGIGGFINVFHSRKEGLFFNKMYQKLYEDKSIIEHAWDYQANYAFKKNGGLSIVPQKNLVTNIGIVGTHSGSIGMYHNRNSSIDFRISQHPDYVLPFNEYDAYHFYHHFYKYTMLHRRLNHWLMKQKLRLGKVMKYLKSNDIKGLRDYLGF